MAASPVRPEKKRRRFAVTDNGVLLVLGLVCAGWLAAQVWPVIVAVVVALILVGTLIPAVRALQRLGLGRTGGLAVIFLAMVAGLLLIGFVTIPALVDQLRQLADSAPEMQRKLVEQLERSHLTLPIATAVRRAKLQEILMPSTRQALEFSSRAIEVVGWGLTTLALAFYILADPSSTQAALYAIVPRRFHIRLARIMLNLETIVGGYMRGQIVTSVLMSLFAYVLLRVCNVKNPLPLAVFAGITDVLPLIGGVLGAVPLVAAALPRGTVIVVVVVIAFAAYQEVENRIIIPRVYGHVLRLPAWAITIALLLGAKLMGIVGALLSLPVAAGARMILEELRFELPGDGTVDQELRERDERVETLYAELSADTGPATSATIAIEIADSVRRADAAKLGNESGNDANSDARGAEKAAEVPLTGGEPRQES
jgi:predicted PurR-regulated permease PerM